MPPKTGHNPPNILNNDDFPQPFGPLIITFIPGVILNDISLTSTSPFGETIGTLSNSMTSSV
mgnify:CR=1 FL=1